MHKALRYVILLSLLLVGTRCTRTHRQTGEETKVIRDMRGREVEVPEQVEKVIGLRAGALRLLVYMDAVDLVAGIEETERRSERPYTIAYPKLKERPVIGPPMGGDAELILKANPDVIFISYTTRGDADALQKKTGIPVVAIECPEFSRQKEILFDSFRLIGKILHKQGRADSLIRYINRSVYTMEKRTHSLPEEQRPEVYIGGVPYSGSHGISYTQPYYPPFAFTNAQNVAAQIDEELISHVRGTFIDKEQLIIWNPDYLFIDQSGLSLVQDQLRQNKALYEGLKAVRNNKVFTVYPYNNYAINYELVLANSWYVAKILYPGRFEDVDVDQKTGEIFRVFLGKDIRGELAFNSPGLVSDDWF